MSDELQDPETILRMHKRRLQRLEERGARDGAHTPPEILNEMDDIRAEIEHLQKETRRTKTQRDLSSLIELRTKVEMAYYKGNWAEAIKLLKRYIKYDSTDSDIQDKLVEAERQLHLQALYRSARKLRDERLWQAVLKALNALELQQKNYPDVEGLRAWAEERRLAELGATWKVDSPKIHLELRMFLDQMQKTS